MSCPAISTVCRVPHQAKGDYVSTGRHAASLRGILRNRTSAGTKLLAANSADIRNHV